MNFLHPSLRLRVNACHWPGVGCVVGLVACTAFALVSALLPAGAYAPLAAAVAPQADRAWAETRAWRDRVGRILESINTAEVRDQVASRLSDWIERFRG